MAGLHKAVISYKQKAIADILSDDLLVKAIDPRVESIDDMIYRNIYPFFRIPVIDSETLTYITVCVDFPETYHPENYMRQIALKICIIVHQDQMRTEYGATRLDYIAERIDSIFLNSNKYGFGKLKLLSSSESSLTQFHRIREMIYVSNEAQGGC